MRITNKIMHNNSIYNINNNKVAEDTLNTQMATGKKINRPSEDPVIAIRALRLRSSVTQLEQYYKKNASDAESWLKVTEDSLSTVTDVLTDAVKQCNKGSNEDLTVQDLDTIVTQLEALSKEYYSTGNVDYAGRYVFTGFRTNTSLSYEENTTAEYKDINDECNSNGVDESKRILNKYLLSSDGAEQAGNVQRESDITEVSVGRIRLSYSNLDYKEGDGKDAKVQYREALEQPATSTVSSTSATDSAQMINLTYKTNDGVEHRAYIPVTPDYSVTINDKYKANPTDTTFAEGNFTYSATGDKENGYTVTALDPQGTTMTFQITKDGVIEVDPADPTKSLLPTGVQSAVSSTENMAYSTVSYNDGGATAVTVDVPLVSTIEQGYTINFLADGDHSATVNSDGTYTLRDTAVTDAAGLKSQSVIQITDNGTINSSYHERTINIDSSHIIYSTTSQEDIDKAYDELNKINESNTDAEKNMVYLNADTGELLLNNVLKSKFEALPNVLNTQTIDVIYDKKEFATGDIRPENLFNCVGKDANDKDIKYNHGSSNHDIAYDVGYAQSVVVNTTADAVFTTDVKRNVEDLRNALSQLSDVSTTLTKLQSKLESGNLTDDEKNNVQYEYDATKKAYNYLRENIQNQFESKITSMQESLDKANVAVTDNGTRSKRLELVQSRLQGQLTTFKTLRSDNEDADIAETATNLATAQLTYQASLMATGKISQTSLMNYI